MEQLFVQCVEEIRKDIVRRRLKNEFTSKRKNNLQQSREAEKQFELSLVKLADLAKSRVKYDEFTANDRTNLLDLFVNNEKVLLSMHEMMFPASNSGKNINSLRNPSEKVTLHTDRQPQNLTDLDNSYFTISAELEAVKLSNKSAVTLSARNKNQVFASMGTPIGELTKKSNLILETDLASNLQFRIQNPMY